MRKENRKRMPLFLRILLILIAGGIAVWLALVAFVTIKEWTIPAPSADTEAIIVLGAQVKADGRLSLQLHDRLDLAVHYYNEHRQPIVVCGAQGSNEPVTEASAMKAYLISQGVPESDILMDDTSFNTRENLVHAKDLLPQSTGKVLIVTSDYHLPRALSMASDVGFDACGAGSKTLLAYWPKNHFREALSWVKYGLQKIGLLAY